MQTRLMRAAALLAAAGALALSLTSSPARAQVPNRVYGTVMLNGTAAPAGTAIVAFTNGTIQCGTATVTAPTAQGYTYILDVPSGTFGQECKPGAVLTFTVGGQTAGQTFTLDDIGTFRRLDLTAPGTPNVPSQGRTITLAANACTDIVSSWPDNTPAATIAQAVSPASALSAFWRFDTALNGYRGFGPSSPDASDLKTVNRGESLRVCTNTAAAVLTQPV